VVTGFRLCLGASAASRSIRLLEVEAADKPHDCIQNGAGSSLGRTPS